MRKNRLLRLVLAATFVGAVGALSFPPHDGEAPQVDWSYVDETNPVFPPETPVPDYDGDGTPDAEDGDDGGEGNGDDTTGSTPGGGGPPEPEVREPGGEAGDGGAGRGRLGLSAPVQAALSVGLLGLAFLALLPGRRMPENLR
ncbi:hypothetical protein L0U85_14910 [Glycomyces sp. L485]|uniref:hypothetical protein n=1 Tax=Glycomyces sp. L485 TaxID=2909235 RepID=UPI001F4B3BFD|nr:hypothetical protein [Glycomyces sp. L485]MCH7232136.1 hypothetical protein [Glycomyces sp. L485]